MGDLETPKTVTTPGFRGGVADMPEKTEPAKTSSEDSKAAQLRQLQSYARGGRGKLMALAGLQKKPLPSSRESIKKPAYLTPPTPIKTPKRQNAAVPEPQSDSPDDTEPDWLQMPKVVSPKRKLYMDSANMIVKRRRETEPTTAVHGLRNIGNSCYMNAVLQALVSLASFSADMQQEELAKGALPEDGVYKALLRIMCEMKRSESSTVINPVGLKRSIDKNSSRFQGMFQQDAHEFLCNLLDQIQEEVYAGYEKPRAKLESPKLQLQETVCPTTRNFSCIVEHHLECDNCGDSSTVQELFRHFSLDIQQADNSSRGSGPSEVQELLRHFFKDEIYEKTCEQCGFDRCTVRRTIKRLPRILVLHLKRFCVQTDNGRARYTKNVERVCITQSLDLGFCCAVSTKRPLPTRVAKKTRDCDMPPPSIQQPATPLADISNLHNRRTMELTTAEQPLRKADPYDFTAEVEVEEEDEDLKRALQESLRDQKASSAGPEEEAVPRTDSQEDRELERAIALSLQEAAAASSSLCDGGSPTGHEFATPSNRQHSTCLKDPDSREATPIVIEVDDSGDDVQPRWDNTPGRGRYVLHAITSHLGTLASAGHFVTDVFDSTRGQWLRHDDSIVNPVSESSVFNAQKESEGYMFFYVHQDFVAQLKKGPQLRPPSNQRPPVRQYSRRTQLAALLSE